MNVKQHVRANIQRKGRKMGQVELAQVNKVLSDEEMYGDTSLLGDENDKGDEDKASKKAADDINKAFELLRTNYAVKDPQDLLAMSALQLLSKNQSSAKIETVTLPADYTSIENALAQLANDIEELN